MREKSRVKNKRLSRKQAREMDVKISFMEGLVRRDRRYVEALQILGDHYTQCGRYHQSLEVDRRLSRLEPGNPCVFYNLACSYSLNNEIEKAAAALRKALSLGYRDFRWLARDPDLRLLRKHPLYRSIQERIRQMMIRVR